MNKTGKSGKVLFSGVGLCLLLIPEAAQKDLSRNLGIYRPYFENTYAKGI